MADYDLAPSELHDGDEWSEVVATGDYIGQFATRFELTKVDVRGGRWSGVTLEDVRAFEVRFADCDLAGLVLQGEVALRNVVFHRCRLSGAVFAGAQMRNVTFEECVLDDVNFRMLEADALGFSDCGLALADFHAAALNRTRLARCNLRGADFTKAKLSDVDLRSSELVDIRGADCLRGATIDSAQVIALAHSFAAALDVTVVDEDDLEAR